MDDEAQRKFITVKRWADIVIERWEERIKNFEVIDTGALLKSFSAQVDADANGDPNKVIFAFLYYGRFADWGLAGTKTIERKPWYSPVFRRELDALGRIMAERYGYEGAFKLSAFHGMIINF